MKNALTKMIAALLEDPALTDIAESVNLLDDLGMDSLQTIKLLLQIEEEYAFEIDFDTFDLDIMKNFGALCSYVASHAQVAAAT